MRQPFVWLSVILLTGGCGPSSYGPVSPTPSPGTTPSSVVPSGNYFREWRPEAGELLEVGGTVESTVGANELCVHNLRTEWDARASCKRFVASVLSDGQLDAFLRWDTTAPGFNLSLAGEVVLVAADGHFATSAWPGGGLQTFAFVRPGNYTVLVMSYVPVTLPFQIRLEFRPN
jgi:hypothetical protein